MTCLATYIATTTFILVEMDVATSSRILFVVGFDATSQTDVTSVDVSVGIGLDEPLVITVGIVITTTGSSV